MMQGRRAQVVALALALAVGVPAAAVAAVPSQGARTVLAEEVISFPDVSASHKFHEAVSWVADHRVSSGFADGTFRPKDDITRAQMAAFLYRFAGRPAYTPPATALFPDVPVGAKFYREISWLAEEGITVGYANGDFGPADSVTRGAMAAFLYRFADRPALDVSSAATFPDVPVGHKFFSAVSWLSSTKITSGYGSGDFGPADSVSRGAMAAFLYRFDDWQNPLPRTTELVSTSGSPANGPSAWPSLSADGRYVAYQSDAANLVAGDDNGVGDIFVTDRQTGTTVLVSRAGDGTQGDNHSVNAAISADGRYVAYESAATNLVPGDTNDRSDVFVTDLSTGETTRVSEASGGAQGDGHSSVPSISADGRYVAYASRATNLVTGDTNGESDAFVTDTSTGTTTRVSRSTGGAQANLGAWSPSISADGAWVTYWSSSTNLVSGDTNASADVFVTKRSTGATTRVSVSSGGAQGNRSSVGPQISGDGSWIAYYGDASNLVSGDTNGETDVFASARAGGATARATGTYGAQSNDSETADPVLSADGRWIVFSSWTTTYVARDTNDRGDVFITDRETGRTARVSTASDGTEGVDTSYAPSISADGRWIAYASRAANLVAGDTNGQGDVFVTSNPLLP